MKRIYDTDLKELCFKKRMQKRTLDGRVKASSNFALVRLCIGYVASAASGFKNNTRSKEHFQKLRHVSLQTPLSE
jgi:hypothetical protein